MKILFKNALILTLKDEKIFKGELLVIDNKIADIKKKIDVKADKVIDCEGNLLMPGLKNAHTHSAMTFLRSHADDMNLQTWLNKYVFPLENCLKEKDIYDLTKLALLEYLTSGVTATMDMYYCPPMIKKAYDDFKMRGVILCMPNFFRQNFAISKKLIESNKKDDLVKYALGFHAEYTSCEKELKEISKLAHELKTPIYTHMSETFPEVNGCKKRHHMLPAIYIEKLGLFDYGGGVYHGVYLSKEEMKVLKKHNVYVCTCPASNLKLASGIAPVKDFVNSGLKVAIGTDGAASNNGLDLFREMYLVSTLSKYRESNPASLKAFDVLKMATVNSAHMMGLFNADILAKNKLADIIMINLKNPDMQPINNIVSNLVYSGNKLDVMMTMIDGKILYYKNKFYFNDAKTIYRYAQEATNRLIKEGEKDIKKS